MFQYNVRDIQNHAQQVLDNNGKEVTSKVTVAGVKDESEALNTVKSNIQMLVSSLMTKANARGEYPDTTVKFGSSREEIIAITKVGGFRPPSAGKAASRKAALPDSVMDGAAQDVHELIGRLNGRNPGHITIPVRQPKGWEVADFKREMIVLKQAVEQWIEMEFDNLQGFVDEGTKMEKQVSVRFLPTASGLEGQVNARVLIKEPSGKNSKAAPASLRQHPQYSDSDYNYLRGKGYDDQEILDIWKRDADTDRTLGRPTEPLVHKPIPDLMRPFRHPNDPSLRGGKSVKAAGQSLEQQVIKDAQYNANIWAKQKGARVYQTFETYEVEANASTAKLNEIASNAEEAMQAIMPDDVSVEVNYHLRGANVDFIYRAEWDTMPAKAVTADEVYTALIGQVLDVEATGEDTFLVSRTHAPLKTAEVEQALNAIGAQNVSVERAGKAVKVVVTKAARGRALKRKGSKAAETKASAYAKDDVLQLIHDAGVSNYDYSMLKVEPRYPDNGGAKVTLYIDLAGWSREKMGASAERVRSIPGVQAVNIREWGNPRNPTHLRVDFLLPAKGGKAMGINPDSAGGAIVPEEKGTDTAQELRRKIADNQRKIRNEQDRWINKPVPVGGTSRDDHRVAVSHAKRDIRFWEKEIAGWQAELDKLEGSSGKAAGGAIVPEETKSGVDLDALVTRFRRKGYRATRWDTADNYSGRRKNNGITVTTGGRRETVTLEEIMKIAPEAGLIVRKEGENWFTIEQREIKHSGKGYNPAAEGEAAGRADNQAVAVLEAAKQKLEAAGKTASLDNRTVSLWVYNPNKELLTKETVSTLVRGVPGIGKMYIRPHMHGVMITAD